MIEIHVISLTKAHERRARAVRQFKDLGIPFHFFDALDGEAGRELFSAIDEQQFVLHTGRETTPGEIGCFASHKALWQRCVDQESPLIVMEDDFSLAPFFGDALACTEKLIPEARLLRLQDERRGASTPVARIGQFTLERYTKTPHCAMCYAISPDLAARLLELHDVMYAPVDVVMKHVWAFGNPMYCLTPYAVTGSELSFDSMIGERSKCGKRLGVRIRRILLKAGWQRQRLLFNLGQSNEALIRECESINESLSESGTAAH